MTCIKKSYLFTTITFLLWSVDKAFNAHDIKFQKVDRGLKCISNKSCMNTPVCASNLVTYANFTQFSIAKTHLSDIRLLHAGNCSEQAVTLNDIFIAVKTSKKFEKDRMKIIMKTWFTLARYQTWFFTDSDSHAVYIHNRSFTSQHVINTNCSHTHNRKDLCCKTAVEFDYYMKSGKKWFCHFDDDNYVNVPRLLKVLQQYNPYRDWYIGRTSVDTVTCQRIISSQATVFYSITFGTFGAGVCFSKSLVNKMIPHIANGRFVHLCAQNDCADDVTIGYIVGHLLEQKLTEVLGFHSHLEDLKAIPESTLDRQISYSYYRDNVILVPGFNTTIDPTRFFSLHCYLFPRFKFCPK